MASLLDQAREAPKMRAYNEVYLVSLRPEVRDALVELADAAEEFLSADDLWVDGIAAGSAHIQLRAALERLRK